MLDSFKFTDNQEQCIVIEIGRKQVLNSTRCPHSKQKYLGSMTADARDILYCQGMHACLPINALEIQLLRPPQVGLAYICQGPIIIYGCLSNIALNLYGPLSTWLTISHLTVFLSDLFWKVGYVYSCCTLQRWYVRHELTFMIKHYMWCSVS